MANYNCLMNKTTLLVHTMFVVLWCCVMTYDTCNL